MKRYNIQKILSMWKNYEREKMEQYGSKKTESCLTFPELEQYITGIYSQAQYEHVESCDHCQKMLRLFKKYVPPESSKETITERWNVLKNKLLNSIPRSIKLAMPAVILTTILILLFVFNDKNYHDLAQIEPVYYEFITTRGNKKDLEAEKLFTEGISFYKEKHYQLAIEKLKQAIAYKPGDEEFNFYLGLCYLLTGQTDNAINLLKIAPNITNKTLQEKYYWYLGNAYLLKEDGNSALKIFQQVVEMKGDYGHRAREIIEKIKSMKKRR